MRGVTIRVHRSVRDAEADLEAPGLAGYAFGRFAWIEAWQDTLGASTGTEPAIVVVADARVRMVLPLGIARRNGLRVLEFLGGNVTDYNAPNVEPAFARGLDAASVQALWQLIRAALPPHDAVHLLRMPATLDPPEEDGAERVPNPLVSLPGVRAAGHARSVTLPDSYAKLTGAMRPRFVADTQRRYRRLNEVGPVALVVAEGEAAMQDVLSGLKPMKSRRWRETKARDWFATSAFAGFYDTMARMRLPEGRIHGSSLTVSGIPVASHLGLVYRGRFYLLLLGWESDEWQRFSTGRLVVDALLKNAIEESLRVFDFTVGDEAYKDEWVDTQLPLFRFDSAVTARGRLASIVADLRDRLRARAKRVTWLRGLIRKLAGRAPRPPIR
ncbi:GNAT family N-acetyltransferase [Methylobacterium sp. E-045]|uniref:GNAT family N-acetyltransferase n=1 Tax=Methylobacterium sp. E-045 TaxID=2836575 RepID=UPI001FB86D03|nr:GNAT family N-acetyltransferase [Methylobacterium sp. E-045]MCJ2132200.1 GNAT family N-acetyltransferase [Methylobacterium sp. E-045]